MSTAMGTRPVARPGAGASNVVGCCTRVEPGNRHNASVRAAATKSSNTCHIDTTNAAIGSPPGPASTDP